MKVGIVEKAKQFATEAHNSTGQVRKYSGEPYIKHPERVVEIISKFTVDDVTIASAWLHDVVEDTPVTIRMIEKQFGRDIMKTVASLTNIVTKNGELTKLTPEEEIKNYSTASSKAQTVKLADIIDNTWDIVDADPKKALFYLPKKLKIVEILQLGNRSLWNIAKVQIESELSRAKQFTKELSG